MAVQIGPLGRHRLTVMLGVVALAFVGAAANANANQMTVFSCHDPAGNTAGDGGWTTSRTSDLDMYLTDTCAAEGQGSLGLELKANGAGYPNGAGVAWTFNAPSWGSITSYRLMLGGTYGAPGGAGTGSGQAFVEASDGSDPNYDYRQPRLRDARRRERSAATPALARQPGVRRRILRRAGWRRVTRNAPISSSPPPGREYRTAARSA